MQWVFVNKKKEIIYKKVCSYKLNWWMLFMSQLFILEHSVRMAVTYNE